MKAGKNEALSTGHSSLRIIFAGTPDFAAHHLEALIHSQHTLVSIYTQPDRPAGRGKKMTASAVKQLANRYQLPVFQPVSLRDPDAQQLLSEQQADVMVVVAYGLILPATVLQMPRYGCINVHASLLPRWRGAAPIQRAIAAGDQITGISIMQMDSGLDTGPVLLTTRCVIEDTDTSGSLHDKLAALGPSILLETLDHIDTLEPQSQQHNCATYAEKVSKQEAMIDWSLSAEIIERRIRAFNPFPMAYTTQGDKRFKIHRAEKLPLSTDPSSIEKMPEASEKSLPGQILKVDTTGILVACGDDAINILQLQLPGKKSMSVAELLNGYSTWFCRGDRLG